MQISTEGGKTLENRNTSFLISENSIVGIPGAKKKTPRSR